MEKIVLAYSGGLDTSVLIKWLQEKYQAQLVTVTVDVGQQENLEKIATKAENLGVLKHYAIDAKQEFIQGYVNPAIKANALYEEKYPVSSALSRPLIASKLVEVAHKEAATAVAHGCTGKGNDQVRFEVTIKSLDPELKILAPAREWKMSRDQEVRYAKAHGIPLTIKRNPYSIDQNLWGRSIECGPIEHPEDEPPEEAFEWTVAPEKAPDKPQYITIGFEDGVPISLNGTHLNGVELITALNDLAGKHGVGRIDHIEDRLVGIKSREVYECPAATCILEAHKDLEKFVLTRYEVLFKQQIDAQWTFLVYTGLWMEPLREDLEAFINATQDRVSGEVRLKLFKGAAHVVGRSSSFSLYDYNLATYDVKSTFDQKASSGFIELWGLSTRVARALRLKKMKKPVQKRRKKEWTFSEETD